ncbi:hypothetical protein [Anaerovibrio slackiae]|uniref:hypothetical protein n=1 Tax=Anaerovibrio slackiae TaxID=2652309 RepID=UPI00386566BF
MKGCVIFGIQAVVFGGSQAVAAYRSKAGMQASVCGSFGDGRRRTAHRRYI